MSEERDWDMYWKLYWSRNTALSLQEAIRPHTPEQLVAEGLHTLLCRWNHTDQCSWLYGKWDDPVWSFPYNPRHDYLEKAQAILQVTDESTIHKTITTLLTTP